MYRSVQFCVPGRLPGFWSRLRGTLGLGHPERRERRPPFPVARSPSATPDRRLQTPRRRMQATSFIATKRKSVSLFALEVVVPSMGKGKDVKAVNSGCQKSVGPQERSAVVGVNQTLLSARLRRLLEMANLWDGTQRTTTPLLEKQEKFQVRGYKKLPRIGGGVRKRRREKGERSWDRAPNPKVSHSPTSPLSKIVGVEWKTRTKWRVTFTLFGSAQKTTKNPEVN
jgi:hypothetical protein